MFRKLHFIQELDGYLRDWNKLETLSQRLTLWLPHRQERCSDAFDASGIGAKINLGMPSTHKKVIVRKMGRDSLSGYVSPANFVIEGKLELLNPAGKVVLIDLAEIKSLDFVRDFSDTATTGRKTFTTRPRTEGLWVRLKFIDNDVIEGLMANDLTQVIPEGYLITPPDTRGNTQRIFVPRIALQELNVLAVIGRPESHKKTAEDIRQEKLFVEP
jgi:hypothetical protein